MLNKKFIALVATAALATCLGLAGCGGSQAASSSAAASNTAAPASSAASDAAASASAAAASTTAAPAASTAAASTSAAPASTTAASPAAPATNSYIGDQAALDIALADAGFAAADVMGLEVELDLDSAVVHYDVNFKQGGWEYDYDIDATTGAIIQARSEIDD